MRLEFKHLLRNKTDLYLYLLFIFDNMSSWSHDRGLSHAIDFNLYC